MGDRSGLPKIDRTNGFDDGRDYMRVKKSKLAQQNDQIREALRNRNSTSRSELFKGISVNVNGRTQPTADELKRLILLNGGDYHPYYRYQTTKFMIATNLSTARIKQLRPDDRVVRPEWITESIQAKCLLPYQDYQLFVEEPRGKTGTVLMVQGSSATAALDYQQSTSSGQKQQLATITESYSSSYRKTRHKSSQQEAVKSRDIRDMFSRCVRSLETSDNTKKDEANSSQISNSSSVTILDSDNSRDTVISSKPSSQEDKNKSANKSTSSKKKTSTNNLKKGNKTLTMSDFIIKGAKPNRFSSPKVPEKKNIANICGLHNIDDIIGLLNEWVGCPEGIKDEDTACVTKYFYDLMSEKNYHNKLYEVVDAFQQRVIQYDDVNWTLLYNNLIETIKSELNQSGEASQNLYQLLNVIDVPASERSNSLELRSQTLPTIPEIDID